MKSDGLTHKLAFDTVKLSPGTPIELIYASHMPGDEPRRDTGIVKDVSSFKITLVLVHLGDFLDDGFTGKVEEKRLPASAFEGVGCYTLKLLYTEKEMMERMNNQE